MTMTEEQMRNRIRQIDKEREKLRLEQKEYEDYFANKRRNTELDNHKKYIGKCYITKNLKNNNNSDVKAFKIINVLDTPNERNALCTTLINGCREYGVQNMVLGIWCANERRMMSNESDPKMIDFYNEITQEEFKSLYREYLNNIEEGKTYE